MKKKKLLLMLLGLLFANIVTSKYAKAVTVFLPANGGANAVFNSCGGNGANCTYNVSDLLTKNCNGSGPGGILAAGDVLQIGNVHVGLLGFGASRTITLNVDASATIAGLQIGDAATVIVFQVHDNGVLKYTGVGNILTVNGTISLGALSGTVGTGAINMTPVGTLKCQGIILGSGGAAGVGTFTPGAGTIEFTATNNLINHANYSVYNNMTMTAGTTSLSQAITLTGNVHIQGTTGALSVTPVSFAITMNGIGSTWTNDNTTLGISALTYRNGTVTFSGSTMVNGTSNTDFYNITISGTLNGNATNIIGVQGVNWLNNGTFIHGSGTLDFKGLTVMNGSVTNTTINNIIIDGSLTAGSGGASIINVVGNYTNNGTFINATGKVAFNGIGAQAINGTSVTTFHNVDVNNTGGTVTLNQNEIIDATGVLNLIQGPVALNLFTLTVNNPATVAIIRTAGYLKSETTSGGPPITGWSNVTWAIAATTGAHVFPFGNAAGFYIPYTYNLTAGNAGNVTAATYPTNAANMPLPSPVIAVNDTTSSHADDSGYAIDRFWYIASTGGTADMTFGYANATDIASLSGGVTGTDGTGLRAQQWDNATQSWLRFYAPSQSHNVAGNTVKISSFAGVLSALKPWTLALRIHPLPITLLNFKASLNENKDANINWETAQEVNSYEFLVERSGDGVNFSAIATVNGAGNSSTLHTYKTIDKNPLEGLSYYRLKQMDFDGNYTYSPIVPLTNANFLNFVKVFPNPAEAQTTVIFESQEAMPIHIDIYDATGKLAIAQRIDVVIGTNSFTLNVSALRSGIYQFTLTSINNKDIKYLGKFIKN